MSDTGFSKISNFDTRGIHKKKALGLPPTSHQFKSVREWFIIRGERSILRFHQLLWVSFVKWQSNTGFAKTLNQHQNTDSKSSVGFPIYKGNPTVTDEIVKLTVLHE